jgi:hypothetical protein
VEGHSALTQAVPILLCIKNQHFHDQTKCRKGAKDYMTDLYQARCNDASLYSTWPRGRVVGVRSLGEHLMMESGVTQEEIGDAHPPRHLACYSGFSPGITATTTECMSSPLAQRAAHLQLDGCNLAISE